MRVDKFLKLARLIKRRTTAKSAAEGSRVLVAGKAVKPAYNLKIGDIVEILYGDSIIKIKVLSTDEKQAKKEPATIYEIIE